MYMYIYMMTPYHIAQSKRCIYNVFIYIYIYIYMYIYMMTPYHIAQSKRCICTCMYIYIHI